ncbi:MAG: hypothetical protein COY81_01655 [Candidatus Pacebacteria bacterium CG_4_10_14_0_8_um_filter_43_12]|nr:MAG: hypothetical protein COY81_01655 [Candidatus Pacebacteria bacterium CG_4_10_14_0_8_um_filter_43_12]
MKKCFGFLASLLIGASLISLVYAADDFGIGTIDTPPGVNVYQQAAQDNTGADIGIIYFVSNLIKIFAVLAGVWTLFNVILAGYIYLNSSGDAGSHQKVQTQITNSVIGLLFIVLSFTIGGLIGFIFFGDAMFILSPKLPTPIP